MALVPIRIDRTSKPPLGTPLRSDGHWSVQGLVAAGTFNEWAGSVVFDAVSGSPAIMGSGVITWKGGFVKGVNSSSIAYVPGKNLNFGLTYIVSGKAVVSGDGISLCGNSAGTSLTGTSISRSAATPSVFSFSFTNNGARVLPYSVFVGDRYFIATSQNPTGVSSAYFSKNNEKLEKSTFANLNVPGTSTRYHILGHYSGIRTEELEFVFIFDRPLGTGEVFSIKQNPWQIYEPETVWVEVGGGIEAALFAGTIYGQSSASAQLSTAIRFGGALSGSSTTTAALTNAITMAAQAAGLGSISGQLAGTVAAALFAGTISGSSSASANLSTAVILAAAAQGNATAQAALATALELAAQVNGLGSASGALGADISGLAGSLSGSSEAQATLSTAIHLMGLAAGQCGVVGRLAEPVEILAQLRVMASDPLALTISVRDPLALRVTVH